MTAVRAGAVIAGKYVLSAPLAQGGMGAVWLAQHRDLDVPVAVKFMDQALVASEEARARFEREAKASAKLDTKHVVHVLDYGIDGGAPYIVMELLKGEDLAKRLRGERRMLPSVAAGILGQVAKGLRKAHEAGLVHRDLKPANIFLARKDDEEVAKILDFGIAKNVGTGRAGQATASGVVIGSVHYMSPEQARHPKLVDARSDLWSLGVIAFRMVTGRLPFQGEEVGDVLVKVCVDPVPRPSEVAPGLPPAMDAFFARALARNPEERFQSAVEMADAFAVAAGAQAPSWQTSVSLPAVPHLPQSAQGAWPEAPEPKTQVMMMAAAPSEMGTLQPSQGTVRVPVAARRSWIGIAVAGLLIGPAVLAAVLVLVRRAPSAPASSSVPAATAESAEAPRAPSVAPVVSSSPASAASTALPEAPVATAAPAASPSAAPAASPPAAPAASPSAAPVASPSASSKTGPAPATKPAQAPRPSQPAPQPRKAEKKVDLP